MNRHLSFQSLYFLSPLYRGPSLSAGIVFFMALATAAVKIAGYGPSSKIAALTAINEPPAVSATASPACGFAPLRVVFSAAGSAPGNSSLSYKWLFGDGQEAGGADVRYTYQTSGTYTARVVVTNESGNKKEATVSIFVSGSTPPQADGRIYVVSPAGSDSNSGTQEEPFKTVQKAADVVKPGDTVLVEDGVYSYSGPNGCFGKVIACVHKSGTPDNWIVFRSRNKWGAKINGENGAADTGFGFNLNSSYVRIQDFEIHGLANKSGGASGITLYNGGGNTHLIGNHIHDNGHVCTDTANGQNGIFIEKSNVLVEGNIIHDIGRFAPGQQQCKPANENWQNHDHGIYHDGGDDVTIRNNIIYNIGQGWPIQVWPKSRARMNIINNTIAFSNQHPGKLGAIIFWSPYSGGMNVSDSNISNNIFYQVNGAAIWMGTGGGPGLRFDNLKIANNIVSNGPLLKTEANVHTESGLTLENNKENTDPKIVDPAAHDFHLKAESPAIDAGLKPLETITNDFDRCGRPRGGAYDIGAYESASQAVRETAKPQTELKTRPGRKTTDATRRRPNIKLFERRKIFN